jgi:hypothetical protein
MSEDWHKDTPEPQHWLFYVLVKIAGEDRYRRSRFLARRAQLRIHVSS